MLSGALPTCNNFALRTGSLPPRSESLNWDTISLRSAIISDQLHFPHANIALTDREYSNNAVDSHTNYPLSIFSASATNDLYTDVDGGLLTKSYKLGTGTPVPAYKCLISTSRNQVPGGEGNSSDTVQVPRELLKRCECQGRE